MCHSPAPPSGQRQPRRQRGEFRIRDQRRHQLGCRAVEAVQAHRPRADHAMPRPAMPWARAGMGNGWPEVATTASVLPSRHVRSMIRCPPAVTVTGRPTSTGTARTLG